MKHMIILKDTRKDHEFASSIEHLFQHKDYQMIYTHSSLESQKVIHSLKEPTRIYCVGGDGTLHHMIQSIVYTDHELVVVPLGTGNDFCRCISREKNPIKIIKKSFDAPVVKADVIQLNDSYYINSACFGVDRVIANHVHDTPHIPFVPESKSYVVSILQHVFRYGFDRVTVWADDQQIYQGPVTLCTLNNGQYYGGGFQITPQASIEDGYMDICIVDQVKKWRIPYLVSTLMRHTLEKQPEVHFYKAKKAVVEAASSCNVDGEKYVCEQYQFSVISQAIHLIHIQ